MSGIEPIIIITVILALVFDFINGANDAANSISTIVATRVLSPTKAVIWAAFFNFAALWIFQST
ncbi:MAG: inorganic phosphate transporter, partial [Chitinophagales bacterium]|nr:inorganic phosphate transporter [Chitinophagales bacterium]